MSPASKKKTTKKKVAKKKSVQKKAVQKKTTKKKVAKKKTTKKAVKKETTKKAIAPSSLDITPEERWKMVAVAAYHKAEQRGFATGHELEDWTEAEKEIDAFLHG